MVRDVSDLIRIGALDYDAADVLKAVDPETYRAWLLDCAKELARNGEPSKDWKNLGI